ncbi:MAG: antitoxin [Jatrophihabitans sp.]|uniref:antitoxin n=1 Tax=Jatrophihabitans sp. TaxID=1932789 RepID=UPI003F81245A
MPGLDDLKKFAEDHDQQLDQALEKAGDAAGKKFGHVDQIDKAVDWAQEHTGDGDSSGEQR